MFLNSTSFQYIFTQIEERMTAKRKIQSFYYNFRVQNMQIDIIQVITH